jgi:orotidine-5'-phosphate decarboxylase
VLGSTPPHARARNRLAVALDVADLEGAVVLAERVAPHVGVFKIGLELFVRYGPDAVARIRGRVSGKVFLDLKLHDIPETVRRAVAGARAAGADFLTVHASGGRAMLQAAAAEAGSVRILAVTALTSLDPADLCAVGVARSLGDHVVALSDLAWEAGVQGFVASPEEAAALRARRPEAFLVIPGIRPEGAPSADQKRVAAPRAAILAGADMIVVGRPIRDAADPASAAAAIERDIARALEERPS